MSEFVAFIGFIGFIGLLRRSGRAKALLTIIN
jgi:hypothetical protein